MSGLAVSKATIWNSASYRRLRALFRTESPDVAHFHNTFPLLSPAAYYAARAEGVAVVQTLHNFRLVCANAMLYRDGHHCHDCIDRALPFGAVVHACYRGSRAASAVAAGMLVTHRALGTWRRAVTKYVALTAFARDTFIAGGLPADRIAIKPNTLADDPGVGTHQGGYALYVGRLSVEKGVDQLLNAWRLLPTPFKLVVAGSGPLERSPWRDLPHVTWLGQQPQERVLELMRDASFLVFPSRLYEGCPVTLVQAFATGLPVVASRHGSIGEIVADGATGWHVQPGDLSSIVTAVERAIANQGERERRGAQARAEFVAKYTAEANYRTLMAIYSDACGHHAPLAARPSAQSAISRLE
jgi:glycosyltransferase involved in cell wall biosynthesis